MRWVGMGVLFVTLIGSRTGSGQVETFPFEKKVEIYHNPEEQATVFVLRLEQPFLAGEFEKNRYLRLRPQSESDWLIYPRETQFVNKQVEFYGRQRLQQKVANNQFTLYYEVISENLAGSRQVTEKQANLTIELPAQPGGPAILLKRWAEQQNAYFAERLRYYPGNSFLEYVLLQSNDRYGITPPALPQLQQPSRKENDKLLYNLFSSGLAIQTQLQAEVLQSGSRQGERTLPIRSLQAPTVRTIDYAQRLQDQVARGRKPQLQDLAKLVPADQYFLAASQLAPLQQLLAQMQEWGGSLLGMFRVTARDHHLQAKYLLQMGIAADSLASLFASGAVSEMAWTGGDFSFVDGTDVTLLLRMQQPEVVRQAFAHWLEQVKPEHPELVVREFNYRGQLVMARYTNDRVVSSLLVILGDYAVVSNSQRAIRKVIDTFLGELPNLQSQADYQYMTTVLPPLSDPQSQYLYCSEAFWRRLISPEYKIAAQHRLQAFNNLIMINNASLFYRLEQGVSPSTLNQLASDRYIDMKKIVDPAGGSYAFDTSKDTATSSVYNRIKYLTPILELNVLEVSSQERDDYQEFRKRYEAEWGPYFDPIVVRSRVSGMAAADGTAQLPATIHLETAVLPFGERSAYGQLQRLLQSKPLLLPTSEYANTAIVSLALAPGREQISQWLSQIPGLMDVLQTDPTLTDFAWLGDRLSVHVCDDDLIIEVDPTRLETEELPLNIFYQTGIAALVTALNLPIYATIAIKDTQKAEQLLERLRSRLHLQTNQVGFLTAQPDAYQIPSYRDQAVFVLTQQLYAVKLRFFIALVKQQLFVATELKTLQRALDATLQPAPQQPENQSAHHGLLQFDFAAMKELKTDLFMYWAEKARLAAFDNIMPLYLLIKLYQVDVEQANAIADAKYGVTFFDPGAGKYVYDPTRDQVYSTVFGNRQQARQDVTLDQNSRFAQMLNRLQTITLSFRLDEDILHGSIQIQQQP